MDKTLKTLAEFINDHKSVAAASRVLGISRQTIDRWQKGEFKPSPAQVELAKQKGVDLGPTAPIQRPNIEE